MSETSTPKPYYPRRSRLIHLAILAVLCVVNVILATTTSADIVNLGNIGFPTSQRERIMGALLTILVSYNFVGFVLASFVAMIPFKGSTYAQRYVRFAFLFMILIQFGVLCYGLAFAFGFLHPRLVF